MQQLINSTSCPEHIMFCLDVSNEMDAPIFRSKTGEKLSSLKVVKKALQMFVLNKSRFDKRHRFGLTVMHDEVDLVHDFTSDVSLLCETFEKMDKLCQCDNEVDLSSLINFVNTNVELCNPNAPPSERYVVRLILIYGRTHCTPQISAIESLKHSFDNPYFFVDVLYLHEAEEIPEIRNKCVQTFTLLAAFDIRKDSYLCDATKYPNRVYNYMAMLLAHPLQRPHSQEKFRTTLIVDNANRNHAASTPSASNSSLPQQQAGSRTTQGVTLGSVTFV